ncbi:MAG: hypothetical protein INR72_15030 [Williamsia herbipolensis]|nr:hypothetical protein [Williamsia herbipolensis]
MPPLELGWVFSAPFSPPGDGAAAGVSAGWWVFAVVEWPGSADHPGAWASTAGGASVEWLPPGPASDEGSGTAELGPGSVVAPFAGEASVIGGVVVGEDGGAVPAAVDGAVSS